MDKQIIEIANDGALLSLSRGFLVIENKELKSQAQIPLDNVFSVIISANNAVISKNIINAVCEAGGSIIMCGKDYVPASIIIPYIGHWLISPRIKEQIDVSVPLQKNLWKFIIKDKINNQSKVLSYYFPDNSNIERLKNLAKNTLSDDSKNNEGIAARIYFQGLFGRQFIRNRAAEDINILLNYTYMVLRAMVARAVAGNGLLPYLGIKHKTCSNTMPLVDDLIEPFRAIADRVVFEVINELVNLDKIELTPEIKRKLTRILSYPVNISKGRVDLSEGIIDFVSSLVKSYSLKKVNLSFPEIIFD